MAEAPERYLAFNEDHFFNTLAHAAGNELPFFYKRFVEEQRDIHEKHIHELLFGDLNDPPEERRGRIRELIDHLCSRIQEVFTPLNSDDPVIALPTVTQSLLLQATVFDALLGRREGDAPDHRRAHIAFLSDEELTRPLLLFVTNAPLAVLRKYYAFSFTERAIELYDSPRIARALVARLEEDTDILTCSFSVQEFLCTRNRTGLRAAWESTKLRQFFWSTTYPRMTNNQVTRGLLEECVLRNTAVSFETVGPELLGAYLGTFEGEIRGGQAMRAYREKELICLMVDGWTNTPTWVFRMFFDHCDRAMLVASQAGHRAGGASSGVEGYRLLNLAVHDSPIGLYAPNRPESKAQELTELILERLSLLDPGEWERRVEYGSYGEYGNALNLACRARDIGVINALWARGFRTARPGRDNERPASETLCEEMRRVQAWYDASEETRAYICGLMEYESIAAFYGTGAKAAN